MGYQESEKWVTVFEANNIDEANLVKAMLESAAIPVILEREAAGAVYRISVGPLSEVVVKVPPQRADEAMQLLASTPFGMPEE